MEESKGKNGFYRFVRVLTRTLAVLLLLFIGLRLLIQLPAVQTWLTGQLTSWLSRETGADIRIGSVDIRFFSKAVLNEVLVGDQKGDTLLYAAEIEVDVAAFSYQNRKLDIERIRIDKADMALIRYADPRAYNYQFLVDYFSSDTPDTSQTRPFNLRVRHLILSDSRMRYKDLRYTDVNEGIDWEDIELRSLQVHLEDIEPGTDTLNAFIRRLSFVEKSGFRVKNLSSRAQISDGLISCDSLKILTYLSTVSADYYRMHYDSIASFSNYIHEVRMEAQFNRSELHSDDLAYFSSELKGLGRSVRFEGRVRGTVDRLRSPDLTVFLTDQTRLRGAVSMRGLPDFENTYMDIHLKDLAIDPRDIQGFPAYPFNSGETIILPDNILSLGPVRFSGAFTGFYTDFVAYGTTVTSLGTLNSDLNLKTAQEGRPATYSGNLSMNGFDLGRLVGYSPLLGKVSLKAKVKGSGTQLKSMNVDVHGELSSLQFNGYEYKDILLDGVLSRRLFNGEMKVNDPLLDMDFIGQVDFSKAEPVYRFNAEVYRSYPAQLNWIKRDSSAFFTGSMDISLVGSRIDNMNGVALLEDIRYREGEKVLLLGRVSVLAESVGDRSVTIDSDFLNARFEGNFRFSEFPILVKEVTAEYFPFLQVVGKKQVQLSEDQDIRFRIKTLKTRAFTDIFMPDLQLSEENLVEGEVSSLNRELKINAAFPELTYRKLKTQGLTIQSKNEDGVLAINSSVNSFSLGDSIRLNKFQIDGFTHADSAHFVFSLAGKDSAVSHADIETYFSYPGKNSVLFQVYSNDIVLGTNQVRLSSGKGVLLDSLGIHIDTLTIASSQQKLLVYGDVGKNSDSKLDVDFENVEAALFNRILDLYQINVGGIINGNLSLFSLQKEAKMNADLRIDDMRWYEDTLGNAVIHSDFESVRNSVNVDAVVTRSGDKNIDVKGQYILNPVADSLDFKLRLRKTYVRTFSKYLEGLASELDGVVSGGMNISGPVSRPVLEGKLDLEKIRFKIDYLQTSYLFSGAVMIEPNVFSLERTELFDAKGNTAIIEGNVYHDHLDDFFFDINIQAKNTQVLNTRIGDNELFYGEAYASGKVKINGYLDYILIEMGLKTEKGTRINIPLSNPDEIGESSFISFFDPNKDDADTLELSSELSGVELKMDLDVTNDASVFLIFDSKIGDIIEGTGSGDLTMTYSPADDFKMYGNYEISQGKYLFTMQNVINKPFLISEGSYVRWSGDPYDADISIDAIYPTKASLYDLFQDSSFRRLVNVNLILSLTDKLFNPTIGFDIKVLNVDPTTETQVEKLVSTQEERYRQAVSLLVTRRFSPPSQYADRGGAGSGNVVGVNAYELLSNQLSNWLSQISDDVNIGVNYRPGDKVSSEELEVALSTSLFNDRVTIDGNVGYENTNGGSDEGSATSLVGDFNVEVKASKDGRLRFKAYNRSNNNTLYNYNNSPYTQGVGVSYRQEFKTFGDLFRNFMSVFRKKEEVPSPELP